MQRWTLQEALRSAFQGKITTVYISCCKIKKQCILCTEFIYVSLMIPRPVGKYFMKEDNINDLSSQCKHDVFHEVGTDFKLLFRWIS
jgi:hypothetical protein